MKLIVGLGNPGKEYEKTRHNAGFMAVEKLAEEFGFGSFKLATKHKAEVVEGSIGGVKTILAKPQTFMNLSGQSVRSLAQFYKISPSDLIVIFDDVAIPGGTLRIRPDGSAGGHNGMKSIIQELSTQDFVRVRLGIEPKQPSRIPLEDHVLGKFTKHEASLMQENLEKIPAVVKTIFLEGVEKAMADFN
jgi:peptidyl-tRNA hydrolase, PTH1 family